VATLADLEALIGAPYAVPPIVDWREFERTSGLRFPSDYKALCGRYGMLEIDAFMSVDHAGIPANVEVKLSESIQGLNLLRILTDEYRSIYLIDDSGIEVEAEPYRYYPELGGLFPWGATQNGDTLLWLTEADPERWTIVVTDGGSWWHFAGNLTEFLVGVLSGRVNCPILPEFTSSDLNVVQYASEDRLPRIS
jgi:hypothetical protein